MALYPIHFSVGRVGEALMLSHCSGKHISIVFLIDNKVAVFILIKKTWCKFIELEAATTLPVNLFGNSCLILT